MTIDPITGDDTPAPGRSAFLARLKHERSQSPYKNLEDKIFERMMNEVMFPVESGKFVAKFAPNKSQSKEVPAKELFKDAPHTQKEFELCIRTHAEARVVEYIRENVGYPASEPTYDPSNLTGAIHRFFPDNTDITPKDKLDAMNAIAAQEIAAFRTEQKAATKFRSA